ncbi:hypothetical protein OSC52_03690 [Clostridium pasteurianum]|uniref:hypothetical protein n=1 Tax=Clostridium pasteurianum TaxID=1501 RepID=UPI002260ECA6|nr:hypothetical protein [Clostridium pasteurianum]UZW14957.1 hypothetical protein OSC52_03690 [Clostridium pasteurianum]
MTDLSTIIENSLDALVSSLIKKGLNSYVTPAIFGAVGDKKTDDTAHLQSAFDFASANNLYVDLCGKSYLVKNNITIDNINIINGTIIKYNTNMYVVCKNKFALDNVTIYTAGDCRDLTIELVESNNGKITHSNIYGYILCKTKAVKTKIQESTIYHGNYGVLFNDGDSNRTYNGTSYTDSIGKGLSIRDCDFVVMTAQQNGDTVEINCPNKGFSDIVLENNIVELKEGITKVSDANGSIGFGFAGCDNFRVMNNDLTGVGSINGTIHYEWCSNGKVKFNNLINNFGHAIIGIDSSDVDNDENFIDGCIRGISMVSDHALNTRINVRKNKIKHMKEYGIYGAGLLNNTISDNEIIEPAADSKYSSFTYMFFYDNAIGGLQKSIITGNKFYKGNFTGKLNLPINAKTPKCINNIFKNNLGMDFSVYYFDIGTNNHLEHSLVGANAKFYVLNVSPIGYLPADKVGAVCFDSTTGNIYKVEAGTNNSKQWVLQ